MKLPFFKNTLYPILSGSEIGIPLNIISKVVSDANYLTPIISKESILLNILLGFSTYKQDRYLDSIEYTYSNIDNTNIQKRDYYLSLMNN